MSYKLPEMDLKLNYFEFGALYASTNIGRLPKTLRLKMKIMFAKAYVEHPQYGKQAREEVVNYEKQLEEFYMNPKEEDAKPKEAGEKGKM
jgi:hypothetical protein